jgi:hypothetical protein
MSLSFTTCLFYAMIKTNIQSSLLFFCWCRCPCSASRSAYFQIIPSISISPIFTSLHYSRVELPTVHPITDPPRKKKEVSIILWPSRSTTPAISALFSYWIKIAMSCLYISTCSRYTKPQYRMVKLLPTFRLMQDFDGRTLSTRFRIITSQTEAHSAADWIGKAGRLRCLDGERGKR